jgi:hypothetical protein
MGLTSSLSSFPNKVKRKVFYRLRFLNRAFLNQVPRLWHFHRQSKAVAALLVSRTDREAAEKAGVSPKAIQRWRQIPEFAAAIQSEQDQIVDVVSARILASAELLSKRALNLADNINVELGDLIKLVQFVLPFAVEMHDRKALLARIATLEQMHNRTKEPWEKTIEGEIPCQKLLP